MTNAPPSEINYRFNDRELKALKSYGAIVSHSQGDVLFESGDTGVDCCVVLSGQLDVYTYTDSEEKRVGWLEPGQFAGDLSVLTGQVSLGTARMVVAGEVLHIAHKQLKRVLVENSELSDIFVKAFSARRTWAVSAGRSSVTVIGRPYDRETFALQDLLTKHSLPHSVLDGQTDPIAQRLLDTKNCAPDQLPVVLQGARRVLVQPTTAELSEALGLDLLPDGSCADVIVVGAGPAGLAASVYAASEGLSVLTLDTSAPGGQAATSSKIENYLGFPTGISGRELADRAALQAQKFGARLAAPVQVAGLERLDSGDYCVGLKDGRKFKSRAVVLSMGAEYRQLPIERLPQFEGRGIFYGATAMEAQLCGNSEVCVVGAGNSAGQGAVFLSQTANKVHVLYRRKDIRETMSEYLVRRLEETSNIILHPKTEIDTLMGDDRLEGVTTKSAKAGGAAELQTPFVFLFIGAQPGTAWLEPSVATDAKGFLKTGTDIETLDLVQAGWKHTRLPTRFETSWPRVYAVGDIRAGSIKRVASAVGEGSVVVSDIHAALAESLG